MYYTVYPKKYAHGFVVLCFVVVMQSFIMNSHEVFIHIHQGCFAGIGAIVRLPQCQWSKPDGYGNISQCITTTKHSKAKTVCIFLGIYCISNCTNNDEWLCMKFCIFYVMHGKKIICHCHCHYQPSAQARRTNKVLKHGDVAKWQAIHAWVILFYLIYNDHSCL